MQLKKLGRTDLEVSSICLGSNVFGWTADKSTTFRILDAFVDNGGNFVDTADVYSRWISGHRGGESETLIGEWFRRSQKRDKVVLATKVGMEMGPGSQGLSAAHIRSSAEASLQRLQTDYIDLYQSHKDDESAPLTETLEAFAQLKSSGKVRVIGASNYSAVRFEEALNVSAANALPSYECLQPKYNLYDRAAFESELEPTCRRFEVGVIPYYALAGGFLTGKYRKQSDLEGKARAYVAGRYLNDRGTRILDALDEAARDLDAKVGEIALAWLMAQPTVTAPIASVTNLEQLKSLIVASELTLPATVVQRLNHASE